MTAWAVLLRAVNVGGRNRLPMADMRELMNDLGFPDAATYLQSGNVLCAAELGHQDLVATIKAGIAERFGHDIAVMARSLDEMAQVIESVPWEYPANSSSGVVFMSDVVDGELDASAFHPDSAVVDGANIHVDCPTGFGETKLTAAWIEKQTGLAGTRRNWKTVKALHERLAELP